MSFEAKNLVFGPLYSTQETYVPIEYYFSAKLHNLTRSAHCTVYCTHSVKDMTVSLLISAAVQTLKKI
jgi:hypothetical protein